MLSERKHVTLHEKSPRHADISILGTCAIEVTILEDSSTLKANFDEVVFCCSDEETEVVCKHHNRDDQQDEIVWHLELDTNDAIELEHLMEEVEAEFETLMNDL